MDLIFDLDGRLAFVSGGDAGVRKDAQLRGSREDGTVNHTAVMIGDRAADVLAARACGLSSIAVLGGGHPDRLLRSRT